MSLIGLFKGKGTNGFGYVSTAEEVSEGLELTGQRILITGCTSGIGLECARTLSLRGATILGIGRSRDKAEAAMSKFASLTLPLACDLSEPESVRACVAAIQKQGEPIDAIIANAGIMALPRAQQKHGLELQLFTNHIGHFLLITGLLPQLSKTGRIVMVSSSAHRHVSTIRFDDLAFANGYSPFRAYGQSKLANLLFAKELARRFEGSQRVAMAVHPGVIATQLGRHMNPVLRIGFAAIGPFCKTVEQGAATQVFAAAHPEAVAHNGAYLADCNPAVPSRSARDPELAAKLWRMSEEVATRL